MAGNQAAEERQEPRYPAGIQRVAIVACAILFALIVSSVVHPMAGQSPAMIAVTAAALVIGLAGTGWH
ncbi:MAG: hypothetical protein ACRDN0_38025, partial [Trebonia sp.]